MVRTRKCYIDVTEPQFSLTAGSYCLSFMCVHLGGSSCGDPRNQFHAKGEKASLVEVECTSCENGKGNAGSEEV